MALLAYFPQETTVRFIRLRYIAFVLSFIMCTGSIFMVATQGLNFGIDFKGGILIEVATDGPANIGDMRHDIGNLDLGDFSLQEFGSDNVVLIRIQSQDGDEKAQQAAIEKVRSVMPADASYRRTEFVGPTVGAELIEAGVEAVVFAILAILVYVWFRFEWQFGLGAVVALAHDVILTLGFFSFLQLDFNLSTVAAILTIAGYSINDTVIVYDRVREELRKFKKMPLAEVIDLALNRTLSRTLLTSVTTLLALGALYFFGGAVIAGFALAMIWGIVIGTYSSIYIASPVLLQTGIRKDAAEVGVAVTAPQE